MKKNKKTVGKAGKKASSKNGSSKVSVKASKKGASSARKNSSPSYEREENRPGKGNPNLRLIGNIDAKSTQKSPDTAIRSESKKGSSSSSKRTVDKSVGKIGKSSASSEAFNKSREANGESGDIIDLILRDHVPLKDLIETLKDGDLEREDKEGPYEMFVPLLLAHAKAEAQSLYEKMKDMKELRVESYEGFTEHDIAEQLVQEINATPDDDEWNAKVKVLAEMVEHHIEEEEEEMFSEIEEKMNSSVREEVGELYREIKTELELLTRPLVKSPGNYEKRLN